MALRHTKIVVRNQDRQGTCGAVESAGREGAEAAQEHVAVLGTEYERWIGVCYPEDLWASL